MRSNRIFIVASMAFTACSQPSTQALQSSTSINAAASRGEAMDQVETNLRPVRWPMGFKEHSFEALCYDTLKCSVWYAGLDYRDDRPTPPSSRFGSGYLDDWSGGHLGIRNFPDPAEVTWTTNDGREHKAEIDIGEIFRDELIRHNVAREEIPPLPDGEYSFDPSILLEVNGAVIRVYTRAQIPTRHLRTPGNPNSDYRSELILVKTYNY